MYSESSWEYLQRTGNAWAGILNGGGGDVGSFADVFFFLNSLAGSFGTQLSTGFHANFLPPQG